MEYSNLVIISVYWVNMEGWVWRWKCDGGGLCRFSIFGLGS